MPRRVCYVNELKKRTHQRVIDLLRHVVVADRESESGTFGSDPPIMVGESLNLLGDHPKPAIRDHLKTGQ
jgi:hypothetical protein